MWVVMLPELYPTCNAWFPEPANVVVTLGWAIWITVLEDSLSVEILRREMNGPSRSGYRFVSSVLLWYRAKVLPMGRQGYVSAHYKHNIRAHSTSLSVFMVAPSNYQSRFEPCI